MPEAIAVTIVLVSFMTGLYFILSAAFNGRKSSALIRARADLQTKLLDRLGSGREVVEFCQTEGGKQFVEALSLGTIEPPTSKGSPTERILGSVQKGIILTLLGFGFLSLAFKFHRDDPGDVFMVIGIVGLSSRNRFPAFCRCLLSVVQVNGNSRCQRACQKQGAVFAIVTQQEPAP